MRKKQASCIAELEQNITVSCGRFKKVDILLRHKKIRVAVLLLDQQSTTTLNGCHPILQKISDQTFATVHVSDIPARNQNCNALLMDLRCQFNAEESLKKMDTMQL